MHVRMTTGRVVFVMQTRLVRAIPTQRSLWNESPPVGCRGEAPVEDLGNSLRIGERGSMASAQSASLYRGSGGSVPSGAQGQSPWSEG